MVAARSRRGFTLIEVMVAAAVSSVVMYTAFSFLSFGSRTAKRTGARTGSTDSVGSAFLKVAAKARYAGRITSPAVGRTEDTFEFSDLSDGTWRIFVEGNQLVLQEAHGSGREVLARGFKAISFRRDTLLDDHMVMVTFDTGLGAKAEPFETVIYTRGTRRPPGR